MTRLTTILVVFVYLVGCNQAVQTDSSETEADSAQQEAAEAVPDTLDEEESLRIARARIQKLGVPTPDQVDSLRSHAYRLFESDSCSAAVDSLKRYAQKANWLSNLIDAGLEPFYSGSYDDREEVPYAKLQELSEYENRSNDLKRERNEAYVMIAECSVRTGGAEQATAYYFSALDLINPTSTEL